MLLHITNDYAGSTVYKNLVTQLDNFSLEQIVYTPLKEESKINRNTINFKVVSSKIIYSKILNKHLDRVFYRYKIRKILKDIEKKIDVSKITFIHAHTWYSDGGVAYLLHKKYNIPYIVAIRNSDLNYFQKYLIHERTFGREILDSANNVILIASSYRARLLEQVSLRSISKLLVKKINLIPNGVDQFWIDQARPNARKRIEGEFNILFVGRFSKGKRLYLLQQAVLKLNKRLGRKVRLHIVGGGGADEADVLKCVAAYPDIFRYYGTVHDKDKLLQIYRNCHIFAMPSKRETFGLVYIEALLQGLPILYTKNEGVAGYYPTSIGEAVDVGDIEDIEKNLKLLYENYDKYLINVPLLIENHSWALIANKYLAQYSKR